MDKKEYYGKSNTYLKKLDSKRNHIIRENIEKQYQEAGSSKETRKE